MKTIELMSTEPRSVRAVERLDAAGRVLWEGDCGLVPVVDASGILVGVVTDRDLCMASYIQGRPLSEIPVSSVMAKELTTCRSEDPVTEVMQRMQRLQVHRLPVVDAQGKLIGVVSTNDLVRACHARPAAVEPAAVIRTLAAIGAPRRVTVGAVAPTTAAPSKAPAADAGASAARPTILPKKEAARSPATGSGSAPAKPPKAPKPGGKAAGRDPVRASKKSKKRS